VVVKAKFFSLMIVLMRIEKKTVKKMFLWQNKKRKCLFSLSILHYSHHNLSVFKTSHTCIAMHDLSLRIVLKHYGQMCVEHEGQLDQNLLIKAESERLETSMPGL